MKQKYREVSCCVGCHSTRFIGDMCAIINSANPLFLCPFCGERKKIYTMIQLRNERIWYKPNTWILPEWRDNEN